MCDLSLLRVCLSAGGSVPDHLMRSGVACYIYDDRPSIMHHKAVFVDDLLFVGSYNFQDEATFTNCENLIQVLDDDLFQSFLAEYTRILALCREHVIEEPEESFGLSILRSITPLWYRLRWYLAPVFCGSLFVNVFLGLLVFKRLMKRRGEVVCE